MKTYLTDCIQYPPPHFYNRDIHLNILPQAWFKLLSADRTPIIQDPRDFSGADPGLDEIRNVAGERPKSKQVPEKESFTKRFQRFNSIDSKIDSGRSQSVQSIKNKGSQVPSTLNSSRKSRESGVRTSLGAKGKKPPTVKGGGLLPPSSKRSSQLKSTEGGAV